MDGMFNSDKKWLLYTQIQWLEKKIMLLNIQFPLPKEKTNTKNNCQKW
jgi:hypothetical protein